MASQVQSPLSKECRAIINQVVPYELHVSDAYLPKACYSAIWCENTEAPFLPAFFFFENHTEVKREHAKQFLK